MRICENVLSGAIAPLIGVPVAIVVVLFILSQLVN